jgi:hypothetical protein
LNLKTAVLRVAIAAVLLRFYPAAGIGARHTAAQVLGGFLARQGWNIREIEHLVDAVASEANDPEVDDRVRAAADQAAAHAQGGNTYGAPELRERWGEAVAKQLAKWLGSMRDPTQLLPADATVLDELNREYCIVRVSGKTRVLTFRDQAGRRVPEYLGFDDFRNFLLNRSVKVGDKMMPLGQWWLRQPGRRQYAGVVYQPRKEDGPSCRMRSSACVTRAWF